MAQPESGQVEHARALVAELGGLLSDITSGRDAAAVHERLLAVFDAAEHDSRVDAMEVGRREFAESWDAIRDGRALPEAAWEQVVLPTVVAFSSPQQEKIRLERATAYWLAARAAVDAVPDFPAAAVALAAAPAVVPEPVAPAPPVWPETPLRAPAAQAEPVPDLDEPHRARHGLRRARSGPDRRVLVAVSVAVLATVTVMVVLMGRGGGEVPLSLQDGVPSPGLSAGTATGDGGPVTLPTAPPTSSAPPLPMKTGEPTPKPTWSPPAPTGGATPRPPQPPTAARNLTAVASDRHRVWLSWSAPAVAGSGGVSYYEVRRGGSMIGWSTTTSVTVGQLTPGTAYTFYIVVVNGAGLRSPASNLVTVTTASLPTSPPASPAAPSPSAPSSPSPTPTPTPSPEPSTVEPSPSGPASPSPVESSPGPEPSDPGDGR